MDEQKIDTVENEPVIATDTGAGEIDTINSNEISIIEGAEIEPVEETLAETTESDTLE